MPHALVDLVLADIAAAGADAQTVAMATTDAVRGLLEELLPVVGLVATQALYARSLHLARSSFVRSDVPSDAASIDELLVPLHRELASRDSPDALRAARALLHAFVDLLESLIGEALTHRMLRTAWRAARSGPLERKSPDEPQV